MKLTVYPSRIAGSITVPGSKSHTIRGIVAALAADGVSTLRAPLDSADTRSVLAAATALGALCQEQEGEWHITGTGGHLTDPRKTLDLGNSGTGLRLLTAMAATGGFPVRFDGDASLRTRLMEGVLDALRQLGAECISDNGKCPLTIRGPLEGGTAAAVDGTTSQFLTALLFAAPLARRDCILDLEFLNEKPYIGITLGWLDRLGIRYRCSEDLLHFEVPGRQRYRGFEATIPADFSTAAFPLVAAALIGDGVEIRNLDFSDVQGDKAVFEYLARMNAACCREKELFVAPARPLQGGDFDLNATPDALPVMAVAGAAAAGTTRLLHVPQARVKETDRIACMTRELRKMGVAVEELPDGMIIRGGRLHGAELDGCGDHRIVMALAVAALAADSPSVIHGVEAAAVTYPDFVADFQRLGAAFEIS